MLLKGIFFFINFLKKHLTEIKFNIIIIIKNDNKV